MLSGYVSLRDIDQLTGAEVSLAIDARREGGLEQQPKRLPRSWVLGTGVRHAFNSEMGRYRFVETLESNAEPEGPPVEPPPELVSFFSLLEPRNFEWIQLVGSDDGHNFAGVDFRPTHRHGDEWVDQQEALRRFVQRVASDDSLLYRAIILQRLEAIRPSLIELTSLDEFVNLVPSPAAGVSLIGKVPIEHVVAELLFQALRNPAYSFRQHDQADIYDLAHSIPYCDVVAADKHWAHLATAGHLDSEYRTTVLSGIGGLAKWADSALH
ncbi:hypothetical protein D7I47_02285 [Protaetiibacter intestinalis]|uniref:Uncharacterized protein n=2 Tax=Protaetiibacter intestinalis TaxID=2419774 RepID=A0A387B878_9MICO|nr:hypothetical protein D7I47_02285 [Protaetiibacter intestinalis]